MFKYLRLLVIAHPHTYIHTYIQRYKDTYLNTHLRSIICFCITFRTQALPSSMSRSTGGILSSEYDPILLICTTIVCGWTCSSGISMTAGRTEELVEALIIFVFCSFLLVETIATAFSMVYWFRRDEVSISCVVSKFSRRGFSTVLSRGIFFFESAFCDERPQQHPILYISVGAILMTVSAE